MAVLGNRYDSHENTRKYNDKIRNLSWHLDDESRKKSIEMTIKPVELCISILPHFKASRNLFFVEMNHRTYHDSHKVMLLCKKICLSANCFDIILH